MNTADRRILFLLVSMALSCLQSPGLADTTADGIAAYRAGDYERAIELLETARQQEPRDAEVQLWLGITYAQYATSQAAAGTLIGEAVKCLEKASRLDPNGQTGRAASSWLERVRPRTYPISVGACYDSVGGSTDCSGLRNDIVSCLRSSRVVTVCHGVSSTRTEKRDMDAVYAAARHKGAHWYIQTEVIGARAEEPTWEQRRAYDEKKREGGWDWRDLLSSCAVRIHVAARLYIKDLSQKAERTQTVVEATGSAAGYDRDAQEQAAVDAREELASAITRRIEEFVTLDSPAAITMDIPHLGVRLPKCWGLAAVGSIEEAEALPVVAVAPFAWGQDVKDGGQWSLRAANEAARALLEMGRFCVIQTSEFVRRTGIERTAFVLSTRSRNAGRSCGADRILVGNIEKIETFISEPFLGNPRLKSKATVAIKVIDCGSGVARDVTLDPVTGEATRGLEDDTFVKNPEDAPDLVALTQREALAEAVGGAVEALRAH